jgi:hypothetical protein
MSEIKIFVTNIETDRQKERHIVCKTKRKRRRQRLVDREKEWQKHTYTAKQTDIETDRQTGRNKDQYA